jgi:hypothetical protein
MQFKPRLKIYKGSNGKNTFNPDTFEAHSYKWWMYVCKIKGVIVFNDHSYSVTTNGHQWEMKSLLKSLFPNEMKNVVFVNQRQSLSSGIFLDHHYNLLALNEVRLKAAKRDDQKEELKESIEHCKKMIATLKKLGATANMTLVNHRVNAKNSEASRLETQREKSRIAREKRNAVVKEFKNDYESTEAIDV